MSAEVESRVCDNIDNRDDTKENNENATDILASDIPTSETSVDKITTNTRAGLHKEIAEKPQSEKRGLIGKIFRGRQNDAALTIKNGDSDLLDDRPGEEKTRSQESEENVESESEGMDNEDSNSQDDEEDEDEDKNVSGYDEKQHEGRQGDMENFGDFSQAKYHDDYENDEGAEFASLIGSGGDPNTNPGSRANNQRGRGLIGRLQSLRRKRSQKRETPNEARGLLGNHDEEEYSTDENFASNSSRHYQDEYGHQKRDLVGSDEENDDESNNPNLAEEDKGGQYRTTSPSYGNVVDNQKYPYETTGNQELQGRIRGYGHDSLHGHGSFDDDSSRFYDTVSDSHKMPKGYDPDMEKKGLFVGVGKVVSNILRNRKGGVVSEDEGKRMIAYIDELEWRLRQKDIELRSWKSRAEELEVEVERLRGQEEGDSGEETEEKESDADEADGSEDEDSNDEYEEGGKGDREQSKAVLVRKQLEAQYGLCADESDTCDDNVQNVVDQDGTLIDMSEDKPVFDPLLRQRKDANSMDELVDGYQGSPGALLLMNSVSNEQDESLEAETYNQSQDIQAIQQMAASGSGSGCYIAGKAQTVQDERQYIYRTEEAGEKDSPETEKSNDIQGSDSDIEKDDVPDAQHPALKDVSASVSTDNPKHHVTAKSSNELREDMEARSS